MNAKRFNIIMSLVFVLLIGGSIGLTVYSNIWLTKRSKDLTATKLETITLEEKQKVNQKAQIELTKNQSTIDILEKITPKSKDQAKTIAELLQIADDTGVSIGSMTFPSSDLGAKAPVAPAAPAASASTEPKSDTPSKPATPLITQTKPVEGISGILGIEVHLAQINRKVGPTSAGMTYSQLLDFLKAIERNRRTMQVKLLQIQPIISGPVVSGYSLTMTINIFVKP